MHTAQSYPIMHDFYGKCDFTNHEAATPEGAKAICANVMHLDLNRLAVTPIVGCRSGVQIGWNVTQSETAKQGL